MKILLANDGSLDNGGICVFMLQWIRGIKKADKESKICVYFRDHIADSRMEEFYKQLGVCIYYGNISRTINFRNRKARGKVIDDITTIIKRKHIEILHINSSVYGFNVDLLSTAKKQNVPIRITHFHGAYPENHLEKMVHSFLRQRIRLLATDYAGCSKEAATVFFGKEIMNSSKWHFIPNAIPTDSFRFSEENRLKYRKSIRISDQEILLGAVGRLTIGKNHRFLIDVLAGLKNQGIDAKIVILGDGNQRQALKTYAEQCGLENDVLLLGSVNNVSNWLSAFDYYMMPSLSEGLPISAIEAQANGLICILSDRITTDTDLTKNVYHLPLDIGPDPWIQLILKKKPLDLTTRRKGHLIVKQKGFDEVDTDKYVRELYGVN